jgi:hypothetical protein
MSDDLDFIAAQDHKGKWFVMERRHLPKWQELERFVRSPHFAHPVKSLPCTFCVIKSRKRVYYVVTEGHFYAPSPPNLTAQAAG